MTDKEKLEAIRTEIHRLVDVRGYDREMANDLFTFMDSLPNEPVSEDLGDYINELSKQFPEVSFAKLSRIAVRVSKWQKEKMIANTADAMIGLPYENKDGGYTHIIDVSRPLPVGNNKIAIIFKED